MKVTLLASAVMMSSAVLAQTAPAAPQTSPAPAAKAMDDTAMPSAGPMTATEAAPMVAQQSAPAATPEQAAPTQIAQIVDSEFPGYDKNSDGKLDKAEFSAWMVALKSKSDPSAKADEPTTVAWVGQAFTQADADKSAGIDKPELTTFLSQGAG